jgi:hypothetical protein
MSYRSFGDFLDRRYRLKDGQASVHYMNWERKWSEDYFNNDVKPHQLTTGFSQRIDL